MEYTPPINGPHAAPANRRAMSPAEEQLQTLADHRKEWARLPIPARIELLEGLLRRVAAVARPWTAAAVAAKGLPPASPLAGEEWISGPWALLYAINRYGRTLRQIAGTGSVAFPERAFSRRSDGRLTLRVFPHDLYDRLLLTGVTADVWFPAGMTPDLAAASAAPFYRRSGAPGRVALVLGAGNIASIPALDMLHELYAEGAVCLLKFNPVNAYLGPFFEYAFAEFVERGFAAFVYGSAETGAALCADARVDLIHVTGSQATYDAIVSADGVGKTVTAELGNVTPIIVVPGPWSDREIAFQAAHIATQRLHNAGFNCIAAQVFVVPEQWDRTGDLLAAVAGAFAAAPPRPAYYPGADERFRAMLEADAVTHYRENAAASPRTIVELPADSNAAIFTQEVFAPLLACVRIPGEGAAYVRAAVNFANERLSGTLGATLIVHPRTERAQHETIDAAIADLRYGSIGINAWAGVGYFLTETPWGAYPGSDPREGGSGIGFVHNSFLLEGVEKSVVRAPFTPLVTPPWFVSNRAQARVGKLLCDFEAHRTPLRALHVAAHALRA